MRPSKNAIAQAIRIVDPNLTKGDLLRLLRLPATMTTSMRYWYGRYNIRPWAQRSSDEQDAAIREAKELIEHVEKGV